MTTTWAFVRLSRPHFLLGGALMYAVGAVATGIPGPGRYLLGQAMVTFAQVTAHFVNEYADREVDALVSNRTLFSGGSGVLAEGTLSPLVALRAARVTSALTVGLAMSVAFISLSAALIGLVALFVSWAYSMPPLRLLDTGWGELATSLVVAAGVPVVGSLVASGSVGSELVWKMATLFSIHMAMMLAFELPDLDTDRAAGKTVLAVRLGLATTRRLIGALLLTPLFIVAAGVTSGGLDPSAWWSVAVAVGPGAAVVLAARNARYGILTTSAVATLVVLGAGLLVA